MAAAAHEPEPRPPTVCFAAPNRSHWTVHETRDPGSASGTALLFASEDGFRRVRRSPADWRALAAEALRTSSWER
jgi:hypothetical protein